MITFGLVSSVFDFLTFGSVVAILVAYVAASEWTKRRFFRHVAL